MPQASSKPSLRQTLSLFGLILKDTASAYSEHRIAKMGAALAYYSAFSLVPLIVLVLSVGSLALRREVARQGLVDEATALFGEKGGSAIADILQNAGSVHLASWSAFISFIVLLFGASGVFGELQDSLNQIWEVSAPKKAFWHLVIERVLSFTMVFVIGFLMLVALIISAAIAQLSKAVLIGVPVVGMELVNSAVSLIVITILFAVIYRLLPEVKLTWGEVLPGALFSAVLFIIGKLLLGWYVGRSAFSSSYGAAGSFVVILFWVFYSAQIMFLGAEFTRSYRRHLRRNKQFRGA